MIYNTSYFIKRVQNSFNEVSNDNKKYFVKKTCKLINKLDEFSFDKVVQKLINIFKLPANIIISYANGVEEAELSNSDKLKTYLKLEYDIKYNIINNKLIIKKDNKIFQLEELELDLHDRGFVLKNKVLPKLLNIKNENIRVVEEYNPIKKYVYKLAESYKGGEHIQRLSSCIPAHDYGENTDKWQKRLNHYLYKWIVKAAAQMMQLQYNGATVTNKAMLLWGSKEGGTGKTEINKWLFSIFKDSYRKQFKTPSEVDGLDAVSKRFVQCDFEELPLTETKYNLIKSAITSDKGGEYVKGSSYTEYDYYIRLVNYTGSTNLVNRDGAETFMFRDDEGFQRRIIVLEIAKPKEEGETSTNYKEYTKIDLEQLWGQAATLALKALENENENLLFWLCDQDDLKKHNKRYLKDAITKTNKTLDDILIPTKYEDKLFLSSTEIIKYLSKNNINIYNYSNEISKKEMKSIVRKLGHYLSKRGFKNRHSGEKRGWYVNINI